VEGAGGAAADDLGHGLGGGQVGADPGAAGWVEHLGQPADAFGVVAAAAPGVEHGHLRGRIGPAKQEASFFTVIVWRDQAKHAAESLSKGSRVVVVGRLQQRSWMAEDGSARSVVEVVAEELGPSLRWATATTTRATRGQDQ
jgi:single stranded DNA-binding protein